MVEWKKFVVAGIGGLIGALLWYIFIEALIPPNVSFLFWIFFVGFSYFLYKRTDRARHTAGWSCVLISLGNFALPIATLIYSARSAAEVGKEGAAQALGAGIGATILSGIGFAIGLFFGVAFAIAAYFLLKSEKSKKETKK